jgi:hypothetical protein
MAVEGLYLVNACNILLCMTATNEYDGYFQQWERQELLLNVYTRIK